MDNHQITADCIESAYCFIHQKLRVFEYSVSIQPLFCWFER